MIRRHALQSGGSPAKTIVGWERFDDYPKPAEHEPLGINYVYDFDRKKLRVECPELDLVVVDLPIGKGVAEQISMSDGGDKLAGWPCWIQEPAYPYCPRCGELMQFVFQLTTDGHVPFMFGDQGIAYLFQCSQHPEVVAFEWQCH